MSTLNITKNWDSGTAPTEAQLDYIKTGYETFLNSTKLDSTNIQDLAVTTAKLGANVVTQTRRASLGQQTSSSSSTFTTTSTSYTDVTNLTATITTTGRPVLVQLIPNSASSASYIYPGTSSSGAAQIALKYLRDATDIGVHTLQSAANVASYSPCGSLSCIDVPGAGTYVYKMQIKVVSGTGNTAEVTNCKLLVYEL